MFDWDDFVWCPKRRRYLWADGTETRVIRGVELDAMEAVRKLRNIA